MEYVAGPGCRGLGALVLSRGSRCVANAADSPMPSIEEFLAEWRISPEDWTSERGNILRQHASLFETLGKRADAYGTRVLALPLVEVPDAFQVWRQLWGATGPIREIVEFDDADAPRDEEWRGRSEAAQLIRLAFGLGLMMMDQIIMPVRPLTYDRRATFAELLPALAETVKEMAAIDHSDQGYWGDAMRHLAIRRAVWLSGKHPESSPMAAVAFDDAVRPMLEDFVRDIRGDVQGLMGFIEVALRNHVYQEQLRRVIETVGFNLRKEIDLATRLVELDPKRARITPEQLEAAQGLLS
jgi:hypothetical protein